MDLLTMVEWPVFLAFVGGAGLGIVAGYLLRAWRVEDVQPVLESSPRRRARTLAPVARPSARTTGQEAGPAPLERAAASPEVEIPPPPFSGDWEAEGDGPRVLLADDRLEMLGVHAAYLRKHGYRILLAENGRTAVAFARAYHPALIVLDHSMPDLTGVQVARELKADRTTADIPILLMTAHSYGAVGTAAIAAGCAAFLPKPVEPSRLLREIEARTTKH